MINKIESYLKSKGKRQFYLELLIALILLSFLFWFQLFDLIPSVKTIQLFGGNLTSYPFEDFNVMAWVFSLKLMPFVVLVIWYLTCHHWWKTALLVPMIFSLFQLIEMLSTADDIDQNEFKMAFLLSLPFVVLFVWLLNKFKSYRGFSILQKELSLEVAHLISSFEQTNKKTYRGLMNAINHLKFRKLFMSTEDYLFQLTKLRNLILDSNESTIPSEEYIKPTLKSLKFKISEFFIVSILIFWPTIFYLYLLFPETRSVDFILFELESQYYPDVQTGFWLIFIKINLIILLLVFYFTSKIWWKYAILPVLSLTCFQCYSAYVEAFQGQDIMNYWYGILVWFIIVSPICLLIETRIKLKDHALMHDVGSDPKEFLKKLIKFEKNDYQYFRKKVSTLAKDKAGLSQKEYLYKLMALQKTITKVENTDKDSFN